MERITKFQEQGLLLEKAIHIALTILEIPHTHNPFDKRYANKAGQGCDIEISTTKGKIGIEAKNNNGTYGMSPYWLRREFFSRFGPQHFLKILLCAFATISYQTAKQMRALGYHIIELGFKVTKANFKKAIHVLIKKLYWIKKLFTFVTEPLVNTKQLPMSNFIRDNCLVTSLLSTVTTTNNNNYNNNVITTTSDNIHQTQKTVPNNILTSITLS